MSVLKIKSTTCGIIGVTIFDHPPRLLGTDRLGYRRRFRFPPRRAGFRPGLRFPAQAHRRPGVGPSRNRPPLHGTLRGAGPLGGDCPAWAVRLFPGFWLGGPIHWGAGDALPSVPHRQRVQADHRGRRLFPGRARAAGAGPARIRPGGRAGVRLWRRIPRARTGHHRPSPAHPHLWGLGKRQGRSDVPRSGAGPSGIDRLDAGPPTADGQAGHAVCLLQLRLLRPGAGVGKGHGPALRRIGRARHPGAVRHRGHGTGGEYPARTGFRRSRLLRAGRRKSLRHERPPYGRPRRLALHAARPGAVRPVCGRVRHRPGYPWREHPPYPGQRQRRQSRLRQRLERQSGRQSVACG